MRSDGACVCVRVRVRVCVGETQCERHLGKTKSNPHEVKAIETKLLFKTGTFCILSSPELGDTERRDRKRPAAQKQECDRHV